MPDNRRYAHERGVHTSLATGVTFEVFWVEGQSPREATDERALKRGWYWFELSGGEPTGESKGPFPTSGGARVDADPQWTGQP